MKRRRSNARRSSLAAAAIALTLGACSGTGPVGRAPAATVDGRHISVDTLDGYVKENDRYNRLLAEAGAAAGSGGDVTALLDAARGDGAGTYSVDAAGSALNRLVAAEALEHHFDSEGEPLTDAEIEAARTKVTEDLTAALGDATKIETLADDYVDVQVRIQAIITRLTDAATAELVVPWTAEEREARLQEAFEEYRTTSPLCVSFAFATDGPAAQTLRDRIDGGEEFDAVAAQTVDPTSGQAGGPVGCLSAAEASDIFGEPLDGAVGDIAGPYDLSEQFGTHVVVQIDSVTGAELEDVRVPLEQQVASEEQAAAQADSAAVNQAVSEELFEILDASKVSIDPRYGTWDSYTATVVAPFDPAATTTTMAALTVTEP